jgi:hypothetical protein
MKLKFVTYLALTFVASTGAARAECYDVYGCSNRDHFRLQQLLDGPNCEFLYEMRNSIYAAHHYCFHTPRAIATFGNAGCLYRDPNLAPLNAIERDNAAVLLRAEQMKGCAE